jgi:hypothetical protein
MVALSHVDCFYLLIWMQTYVVTPWDFRLLAGQPDGSVEF